MTWDPVAVGEPRGKGGKQGRQAKGRKAIPPGVAAAVQAAALEGQSQVSIARAYGVSRHFVQRLSETVRGIDADAVMAIKRGLPSALTVLAGAMTTTAINALDEGDIPTAMKTTFGAKLATEANRWAQPAADNPGATLLAFIEALNVQVNVTTGPTDPPLDRPAGAAEPRGTRQAHGLPHG